MMRKLVLVATAALIGFPVAAQGPDYAEGLKAINEGHGAKAYALFFPCAQKGNSDCQNAMGVMFQRGASPATPKSDKEAAIWYERAAQQGHPLGMTNFGETLIRLGDRKQGVAWLTAAAGLGEGNAIARIRELEDEYVPVTSQSPAAAPTNPTPPAPSSIESCSGSVKKGLKAYQAGDYEKALCFWLPKANAGDAAARNNIGTLFEGGLSVHTPKSNEQAARWYLLSAQQGFVLAMRNLARVQDALGFREAATSWIAQALATEQQQAIRQQQTNQAWAGAAYALGCALGGGCMNASPSPNYAKPAYTQPNPSTWMVAPQALPTSPSLCPNGQYVNGPCRMAPDGTFVGGSPRMAPDGTYVGGQPRMAPNGSFVGGDKVTMCPDGTYVGGSRCQLAPNGKYVGVD